MKKKKDVLKEILDYLNKMIEENKELFDDYLNLEAFDTEKWDELLEEKKEMFKKEWQKRKELDYVLKEIKNYYDSSTITQIVNLPTDDKEE